MAKLLEIFQREDGCLSLGRIMVFVNFVNWLIITDVSFTLNKPWTHYEIYTVVTWVAFIALIANKVVECKFFTIKGGVQ